MAAHNDLGALGEDLASAYFQKLGYKLIARNWKCGQKEIDLIATRNNTMHFIEVKTAKSLQYGFPESRVSRTKLRNTIDAAEMYRKINGSNERQQFDILSITLQNGVPVEYFLIEDCYV